MKNIVPIFIAAALILALCTCGSNGSSGSRRSGNGCTICGDTATETFQGSKYCAEHYTNAVLWAFENVAGK